MTDKGIMDVKPGLPLYITIVKFGRVDVHLQKQQKVGEAAKTLVEIFHIKNKRCFYPPETHAASSNCSERAILYKLTSNQEKGLENMQLSRRKTTNDQEILLWGRTATFKVSVASSALFKNAHRFWKQVAWALCGYKRVKTPNWLSQRRDQVGALRPVPSRTDC